MFHYDPPFMTSSGDDVGRGLALADVATIKLQV